MTLLARVAAALRRHDIAFAVIGASALAAHGVSRSTFDIDLLVTDVRVFDSTVWRGLEAHVETRRGDADDPLAGVVRLTTPGERDVDLVIGRWQWQADVIAAARPLAIGDTTVPLVDAPGLVLLKLYAGGAQDAWDIEQLLAVVGRDALTARVDELVARLPERSRRLWSRVRSNSAT